LESAACIFTYKFKLQWTVNLSVKTDLAAAASSRTRPGAVIQGHATEHTEMRHGGGPAAGWQRNDGPGLQGYRELGRILSDVLLFLGCAVRGGGRGMLVRQERSAATAAECRVQVGRHRGPRPNLRRLGETGRGCSQQPSGAEWTGGGELTGGHGGSPTGHPTRKVPNDHELDGLDETGWRSSTYRRRTGPPRRALAAPDMYRHGVSVRVMSHVSAINFEPCGTCRV
jgi:hypothetical protein